VRRWKRWYTVLVGWDHRRDWRKSHGRWRGRKNRAWWDGVCGSNDGGWRQGQGPLCVIGGVVEGKEGVAEESTGVYGTRRTYKKNNKLTNFNFKNVTFILLLIVLVNDLNWENRPHMGYPHPPGSRWNVSEKSKSDFFIFFLSMKVQRKNVLKRK
jgi:hypothetical protein